MTPWEELRRLRLPRAPVSPVSPEDTALVVRTPSAKVVGWLCIVASSFMVIGWSVGVDAGRPADSVMYFVVLVFFCLGVACVVLSGSVEMDSQSLRCKTPWAHYVMRWDELDAIEVDSDNPDARSRALGKAALVFVGQDKRLPILGPSYWRGDDHEEMSRLLQSQMEQRGIEVRTARAAMWAFPRNTKVPRTRSVSGDR